MPDVPGTIDISEFELDVQQSKPIADIRVGIRLNHTYVADLGMSLIHPDGTEVQLTYRNGGSSDDFGSGSTSCAGELAVFSDDAETSISNRSAPFSGPSRPEEPLGILAGKGSQGVWLLRVTDDWDLDDGTFFCFELQIDSNTTESLLLSDDVLLSDEEFNWQIPNPVELGWEGSYRVGFESTTLGDAWSPCCIELLAPDAYRPATDAAAEAGDAQVTLTWKASPSNGAALAEYYTVTGSPGGSCSTLLTSCVIGQLANGVSYSFSIVTGFSDGRFSDPSEATDAVVPSTVPNAPLSPRATAIEDYVIVAWEVPSDDGSAEIESYTVTASPGGLQCFTTGLSCIVTELSHGLEYRFKITASNRNGEGDPSEATDAVVLYIRPDNRSIPSGDWVVMLTADFTGDGKNDTAALDSESGRWLVTRYFDSSFLLEVWADAPESIYWDNYLTGDFTGDGLADIAMYDKSSGTWWVNRSTGTSFVVEYWARFNTRAGWGPQIVGDFNGDGLDDIVNYHKSSGTWWVSLSRYSWFKTGTWLKI